VSTSSLPTEEDRGLRRVRLAQFLYWMVPVAIGFAVVYIAAGLALHSWALIAAAADVVGFLLMLFIARERLRRGNPESAAEIVAVGLFAMCVIGAPLLPWLRAALVVIPLTGVALVLPDVQGARLRRLLIIAFVAEAAIVSISTWMQPRTVEPPLWLRSIVIVSATTIAIGLTFLLLWQDANRLRRSIAAADFHALKLQAIVDRVPIVVFALDGQARFTLSEGNGLASLGVKPGEVVGRSVYSLYAELEWIHGIVADALAGKEGSARGPFGDRVLDVFLRPLDGGAIGIAIDVTERARAEDGLQLLSEASRVLVSATEDPAKALSRVARLAVERFASECSIDLVDESGELRPAASARRHTSDAEPRATISAALLDSEGRPLGMLMASSSERRFGQEDAVLANDLAARAAAAIEARRLYRAAQHAIDVRDEFLSVASHELKTPLTPLRLETTAIERAGERGDVERMRNKAASLQRHVERLAKLVDELLDVGRIRAGRVSLDRTRTDLATVVRDVVARLEPELERAGCAVHTDIKGDTFGEWDPSRVDQIVTNLMSNAAKYGPNAPIYLSLWGDGDTVVLSVEDRGIGIAPADQTRIFRRFERAVSDRNYGGLGLGLFIVHELVAAHGGEVTVRSAPGEGAKFVVTLPRAERISRAS
jgi:signal transduction histidine kinase